jgi:hypothetical protein
MIKIVAKLMKNNGYLLKKAGQGLKNGSPFWAKILREIRNLRK